ncbi:MAG: TetR/AcrR family transcriptional regulator [Treponema sp.]|nr:TetR/AcrR family transcriptional regulator [Treponema sp.]
MENKDFIIQNAISLFSQKGYDGVGVQEICQVSEITKPTLYYYFKSKSGVLEYIVHTTGREHLQKIREALTYNHDFIKGLTEALKTEIDFAIQNKEFFNLHCTLLNSPEGSEQRTIYLNTTKEIQNAFDTFFLESTREFGNMKGKENLYSRIFYNTAISTAVLVSKGEMSFSEEMIYQIIHCFVYGAAN